MDITAYRQSAQLWTPEFLKDQYYCNLDTREICWNNAEDSYGEERERWFNEYNEAKECAEILRQVALNRGVEL